MNLTLFGSRNHFSVARLSSPCLRALGLGVGSLSPPPSLSRRGLVYPEPPVRLCPAGWTGQCAIAGWS